MGACLVVHGFKHQRNTIEFIDLSEECCICFEELRTANICYTQCNHLYHYHCLKDCFKRQPYCPLCRSIIIGVYSVSILEHGYGK